MLRLSSDQLIPGMIVGSAIVDNNGRVLLAVGQVLNEKYIKRIQDLNVPTVKIDDQMGIEESAPPVSPVVISQATTYLKQSYQQCAKTGRVNLYAIRDQVDNILDELISNSGVLVGLSDLKSYDDYTYQHSVNVCVLALMIGISHGYNRPQLQALGTGALLHDIGKTNIPLEILNKPSGLTDSEFEVIKSHAWEGFNIIRDSGELALLSAHVALQHHERLDGKGYPRGLSGTSIHEYGLIAAVADVFDALISDRPYRRGYNNQEAVNIVSESKGNHLDPQFVDLLFTHINLYPPGTVVTLTTRDTAIVTGENPQDPKRPQVKLLFNAEQQVYEMDHTVDLSTYKTVFIINILHSAAASKYISRYLSIHNKGVASQ